MNFDEDSVDAQMQRMADITKLREATHAAILQMQKFVVSAHNWRTCLTCENFVDRTMIGFANPKESQVMKACHLHNAVPPPDIIVHGCKDWQTDDIPF